MPTRENDALTDAEADRLRSRVPDDPIPLPADHLACEGCGIAVPTTDPVVETCPPSNPRAMPVAFARCSSCQEVHEAAEAYVAEHPALVGRYGTVVRDHVESVMLALRLLGKPVPDDLAFVLPRMLPVAPWVRFRNPAHLTPNKRSRHPWAHVSMSDRADLRRAYAALLSDRLALSAPPVAIRCPRGVCLMCGVVSVERPAIEVARRGGREAVAASIWQRIDTEQVNGHVCPDCSHAIDRAGAFGATACNRAVIAHVSRYSEMKARRLRSLLDSGVLNDLSPWWSVRGSRPNTTPWAHLVKVLDSLDTQRGRRPVGPMEEVSP